MIYTAIDTFYLTSAQLENSPSRKDGVDKEVETTLRIYGAELVQEAGILLRLPQVVMATGQVLLHRFFSKQSFCRYNVKCVAASCVWLAAKLEETPRKIRDILFVFHRLNQRREGLPIEPLEQFSKAYDEQRTELIRMERHLLKEMGFICHVEHPHKFIPIYLSQLKVEDPAVLQEAWSLANDSLRTTLCVRFKSEVVACGVIYAATRRARIPLPECPAWWLLFDATRPQVDDVCRALAELYRRPKAQYVDVGKEHKTILSTRAWEPPVKPILKSPSPPVEVVRAEALDKAGKEGEQKVPVQENGPASAGAGKPLQSQGKDGAAVPSGGAGQGSPIGACAAAAAAAAAGGHVNGAHKSGSSGDTSQRGSSPGSLGVSPVKACASNQANGGSGSDRRASRSLSPEDLVQDACVAEQPGREQSKRRKRERREEDKEELSDEEEAVKGRAGSSRVRRRKASGSRGVDDASQGDRDMDEEEEDWRGGYKARVEDGYRRRKTRSPLEENDSLEDSPEGLDRLGDGKLRRKRKQGSGNEESEVYERETSRYKSFNGFKARRQAGEERDWGLEKRPSFMKDREWSYDREKSFKDGGSKGRGDKLGYEREREREKGRDRGPLREVPRSRDSRPNKELAGRERESAGGLKRPSSLDLERGRFVQHDVGRREREYVDSRNQGRSVYRGD